MEGTELYAIVKAGGKQYKVSENDVIEVNKLDVEEGGDVVLEEVLLVSDDKKGPTIGDPFVKGAQVTGKVIDQHKGKKIHGYTYRPKKNYHRGYGHRQLLTSVKIEKIKVK